MIAKSKHLIRAALTVLLAAGVFVSFRQLVRNNGQRIFRPGCAVSPA